MPRSKTRTKKEGFNVRFLPFEASVRVPPGSTVLDAARTAGLPLMTSCGGKGTCGKCLVQIMEGRYETRSSASLPARLIKEGYVLSCLTGVQDDLTIGLPQFRDVSIRTIVSSRFLEEHKNDISGTYKIDPPVEKVEMDIPPPSLENNRSDLRRFERELGRRRAVRELNCEHSALKKLAHAVREQDGRITAVLFRSGNTWTVLDVEPGAPGKKICGLACDLGTTTVVLHVIDLENGEILGTSSTLNPQLARGEDVISRIQYARKPGPLKELHGLIIGAVNHLIDEAAQAAHVSAMDIYYASFSGNTTMAHLFLDLEPRYIREEPYVPTFNELPFFLALCSKYRRYI
jgi:uncharacterized 2Fe-2S/4Fe-4S cluster protein (DUF4445 family)